LKLKNFIEEASEQFADSKGADELKKVLLLK